MFCLLIGDLLNLLFQYDLVLRYQNTRNILRPTCCNDPDDGHISVGLKINTTSTGQVLSELSPTIYRKVYVG